ncbi:Fic/DOC family protein [Solibacillus sp. FSL H8-0538]|uniref:Fic/DOC family protein n=1 Tax=Solibacillus sp. FSL H8-0538 TaxID=2921400 RepID=UPI0030F9AB0F
MSKYNEHHNDDYLLKHNLLGVTTFEKLAEAEAFVFSIRALQVEQQAYEIHSFTLNEFKLLHHHLFQDVYPFAGVFRDVQLMKGMTRFCQFQYIDLYAEDLFKQLQKEPIWTTLEEAAKRLAYYKAELNMLHPFREGNGRTTRIFIQKYAESQNIRWHYAKMERTIYIDAMIRSKGYLDKLESIFFKTIEFID